MNMSKALLLLGAVVLAIVLGVVAFANRAGQSNGVSLQQTSSVEPPLAAKAQDHCWFNVKSRAGRAKTVANGPLLSSTGASAVRLGDLILVTGAMAPAVGDDRFYGCALYEYSEGSPVVVATKTSPSPLRADALVPLGFTSDGRKQ